MKKDSSGVKFQNIHKKLSNLSIEIETLNKQTKNVLDNQERFKLAFKGANIGVWDLNLKTNRAFFSSKLKEMLGFNDSELENRCDGLYNLIHKDDIEVVIKTFNLHLSGKSDYYEARFRVKTKTGNYKWILSRGKAIFNEENIAVRVVGIHIDIDKDVKQEIELNRIKKSFEEAQHIAHIGNWECNIKTSKYRWSDEVYLILNEKPQSFEPTFEKFLEYIYLDDLNYVKEEIYKALSKKLKYTITHRVRLKNGKIKYVKINGETIVEDKTQVFMIGTIQDITDIKDIELALEFNQQYLRTVLDTQRNIVFVNDGERLIDANQAFFKFFDRYSSVDEFLKEHKCIYEFFENSNEDSFVSSKVGKDWLDSIKNDKYRKDKVLIKRDKKSFIFLTYSQNINFYGKNRNIIVLHEITELENYKNHLEELVKIEIENRRKQESLLIQQSKLASMGEMIGAIAHQWRQPLNNLGLTIYNMYDNAIEDEVNKNELADLYKNARVLINQMSAYIDDFRNFFKPSKTKELFLLQKVIDEAISILSAQLKHSSILVNVIQNYDDNIEILGYENEFKHVILNLITNAKDAILENSVKNGKIDITLEKIDKLIKISIEDNGGGIDKKVIDRVFEPYFTTKDDSKGTGIGLYMSKMIIENNMGGEIYIENEKSGAKFIIKLNKN